MKLKKNVLKLIKWVSLFLVAIVLAMLTPFIMFFVGIMTMPNPPTPEVKYAEFPFKLEYELNGEISVVEDILICEFDGFERLGTAGTYRRWNSYLKSENETILLLDVRPLEEVTERGTKILELYFSWGTAGYYMGDNSRNAGGAQSFSYISSKYQKVDGEVGYSAYLAEEAWEKYKIRLISWEIADPIENTFK